MLFFPLFNTPADKAPPEYKSFLNWMDSNFDERLSDKSTISLFNNGLDFIETQPNFQYLKAPAIMLDILRHAYSIQMEAILRASFARLADINKKVDCIRYPIITPVKNMFEPILEDNGQQSYLTVPVYPHELEMDLGITKFSLIILKATHFLALYEFEMAENRSWSYWLGDEIFITKGKMDDDNTAGYFFDFPAFKLTTSNANSNDPVNYQLDE